MNGGNRQTSSSGLVELDVPIEIVAPAFRGIAKTDGNANGGRRFGALRHSHQMHAGFSRRAPTFLAIARDATGNDVLPILTAALGDRKDMIERQLARGKAVPTVLAFVVVARVNVRARERHVVETPLDLDVAEQPDDGRQLEADGNGANLPVVNRDDLDLPLAQKRYRLLPVDDLEGLVRRVQEKRLLHAEILPDPCRGVKTLTP